MIKLKPLLTELTQHQKELKKDYLFTQSKMHSSNTVPSWTEMWAYLKRGDSFLTNLQDLKYAADSKCKEFSEEEATKEIEDIQRHKYFKLVDYYKKLDGERCWREIVIPKSVDPAKLNQLGIYWTISPSAAEAHWAKHTGEPSLTCLYEAKIDLNVMDWTGTMFARMDYVLGDDELEIRFIKNSKLFIYDVEVYDNLWDGINRFTINQYKRV